MRITVIGLQGSGKTTVFRALTGAPESGSSEGQARAVPVPDVRVDRLSAVYTPKKTTYASVEYVDVGGGSGLSADGGGELGAKFLTAVRPATAVVHVIDAFSLPEAIDARVAEDVEAVDTELILADLGVCEKRIERLRKEGAKSGPKAEEARLLGEAEELLSHGKPLRMAPAIANAELLRGFTFLSAKPVITVVNTNEELAGWTPANLPAAVHETREGEWGRIIPLCAQLEAELAALPHEDAVSFLADFGLTSPARERVIRLSYELLGLASFFTCGPDEVRAWTMHVGESAQEAAGHIHTDIARGFIRAEIVDYDTCMAAGSFEEAKKKGKLRLEGKAYVMKDGDVVNFRFNV